MVITFEKGSAKFVTAEPLRQKLLYDDLVARMEIIKFTTSETRNRTTYTAIHISTCTFRYICGQRNRSVLFWNGKDRAFLDY